MTNAAAIILAAGRGKRMKSALPKVAHAVAGKPMLWRVAAAARAAGIPEIVFVLGHGREALAETAARFGGRVAVQERPLGTGDAARCGLAAVPPGVRDVVILCGDAPLIRPATIRRLAAARRRRNAAASVLTGWLPDPRGYGRVVRDDEGNVGRIVEEAD
ncbi:MAG: NTP transferase domain-containing protein, partial [Gemmatimonadota bacterium]